MTDDLLTRLDDAAKPPHYIDDETAREAAARIRELEALVERNAAIAINALERATRAEEWRDHDKTRAEAAEALLDAAVVLEKAASETSRLGAVTGPHWTRLTVACLSMRSRIAAIRAIAAGGA